MVLRTFYYSRGSCRESRRAHLGGSSCEFRQVDNRVTLGVDTTEIRVSATWELKSARPVQLFRFLFHVDYIDLYCEINIHVFAEMLIMDAFLATPAA